MGGYDINYSIFKNWNWGSPVNLGPGINSSSDEFRPHLSNNQNFTNMLMAFSSKRPSGKRVFDLYFTGVNILN